MNGRNCAVAGALALFILTTPSIAQTPAPPCKDGAATCNPWDRDWSATPLAAGSVVTDQGYIHAPSAGSVVTFLYKWQTIIAGSAAFLAGLITAAVVWWQARLLKRQVAFSTYLDLDKEWNSTEMIEARQQVHPPNDKGSWDTSRLEGILEFFEKLAAMFRLSRRDMYFIYESTLGWYAAHYFLFAREHGQIDALRELWDEHLYRDLEKFYKYYLRREVGRTEKAQNDWEAKRLATEEKFWEQERKD